MEIEVLHTLLLGHRVGFKELGSCKAILCLHRIADNGVTCPFRSWIEAEGNGGRKGATGSLNAGDMGDVIKIQDCSHFKGCLELFVWSVVTGEHDPFSRNSSFPGHI